MQPGKLAGKVILWSFIAITAIYTYAIWFILIVNQLIGESSNLVRFASELIHLAVMPSLLLLPLCLLARRKWLLATLFPIATLTLVWYVPYFVPKSAESPPGTPTITVMTFNVWYYNEDYDAMEAVIRAADADVVAIQELSRPIEAALMERLADLYPEQALEPAFQAGLFSKYPLTGIEYWRPTSFGHQRALLLLDGQEIAIYNVHTTPLIVPFAFPRRDRDVDSILARIAYEPDERPVILMGDFNAGDRTSVYRRVTAQFKDAWRSAGQGFGFTYLTRSVWMPFTRLDYIFVDDELTPLEASVLDRAGSDHRPLRVVLAVGS